MAEKTKNGKNGATENGSASLGLGPTKLKDVCVRILDVLEEDLAQRTADNGGHLNLSDVGKVLQDLRAADNPKVRALLADGWDELYAASKEIEWTEARTRPLERLIIQRFSHTLAPHGEPPVPGKNLSRRVIPAFILTLEQMIGPERLEEYEKSCRTIVEKIREEAGDYFEWRMIYTSHNANVLARDILVYIARYFSEIPKRRQWMKDVFTRNMAAGADDAERAWRFDDHAFHILMKALYHEIEALLEAPEGQKYMTTRYGNENISTIRELLRGLAEDRKLLFGSRG